MAFKQRAAATPVPTDPEQLYRTMAGRNGAPPALWIHQGDVLREWHSKFRAAKDVAIELPTGAGKTLVGGLIADWKRRSSGERVAYLCPTNQLAQQTFDNLSSYGIPVVLLTGRVATWSAADRALYTSANAAAVSIYSHVFNSNPALDDAQLLLLDDAHAAESYVSGPWSVRVARDDRAYHDILSVIAPALDPLVLGDLRAELADSHFRTGVHLASPSGVAAVASELEGVLRVAAQPPLGVSSDAVYALNMIRGHAGRCLIYVSHASLLIRPFIAPTGAHAAFESPAQRLYMSATLGLGGELERAFGRAKIDRIPAPKGWDKQGTGRRFFCFPELTTDLSRSPADTDSWVADTLTELKKAVVLTPEGRVAEVFRERRIPSHLRVYEASDIEADLEVFASAPDGVLLLTNRYDGIDLPDDQCRLVVLQSLPARGDLQERFLQGSLGAIEVLHERFRSRVVQGAGRATRNSGDYSVVVVLGSDLTPFCSRRDVQGALHPEVHAEMRFGLDESLGVSSTEMTENIRTFLRQGPEWQNVEGVITAERDTLERRDPPGALELQRAAPAEVHACLAVWQGDWERALDYARQVLDALRGGRAPQRYAALWNYLASGWARRLAEQLDSDTWAAASDDYMAAARAAGRGTTWLSQLAAPADKARHGALQQADPLDAAAAAAISSCFEDLASPRTFDSSTTDARTALEGRSAAPHERALVLLGRLAGAVDSTGDGGAHAAPDASWIFGPSMWVCWEAKSDAEPDGELGANDVRQAGAHLRFVSAERDEPIPSGSVAIVVTPQQRIHPAAAQVAEGHVYLVAPAFPVSLLDRLVRAWRTLRAQGLSRPDTEAVLVALRAESALPTQWLLEAATHPIHME